MRGISLTQLTQEVAQKFTSTTLPRRSDVLSASPDNVANRTSGAEATGKNMNPAVAAIATANAAKISLCFMKGVIFACFAAAVMTCGKPALAQLDRITSQEAASGLKAALEKGSTAAVANLGRTDGFFGNPQVRIPLPESMQRTEKLMLRFGMAKQADELILPMKRAAEAPVPVAKQS